MVATRKKTSRRPYQKTRKLQKGGFAVSLFKPLLSRGTYLARKQWTLAVERARIIERSRPLVSKVLVKRSAEEILDSVEIASRPSSIASTFFGIGARFGLISPFIESAFNLPPHINTPITTTVAFAEFIALAKGDKSIRDPLFSDKSAKLQLNKYKEQGQQVFKNIKNFGTRIRESWEEYHLGSGINDSNSNLGFGSYDDNILNLTPINIAIAGGATAKQARELNTKIAETLLHVSMEGLDMTFKLAIVAAFVTGGPMAAFEATGIPHMKEMAMGLFQTSRSILTVVETEGFLNTSLKALSELRKTFLIELVPDSSEVRIILATEDILEKARKFVQTQVEIAEALKAGVEDLTTLKKAEAEMVAATRAYEVAQENLLKAGGTRDLLIKVELEIVHNLGESKKIISDTENLVKSFEEAKVVVEKQLQYPMTIEKRSQLEAFLAETNTELDKLKYTLLEAQKLYEIKLSSANVSSAKAAADVAKDSYLEATEMESMSKLRQEALTAQDGGRAKALYKAKVLSNNRRLKTVVKAANNYTAAEKECEILRSRIFTGCGIMTGGRQVGGASPALCSELLSMLESAIIKAKEAKVVLTKAVKPVTPRPASASKIEIIDKLKETAREAAQTAKQTAEQTNPGSFNIKSWFSQQTKTYPGIVYLDDVELPKGVVLTKEQTTYIETFLEGLQKKDSFSQAQKLSWKKLPDAVVRALTPDQLKIYIRSQGDVTPDILRGLTRLLQERAISLQEPVNGNLSIIPRKTNLEYYTMKNLSDSERTAMGNYLLREYGKPTFGKIKRANPGGGCIPPCELDHKVPVHAFSTALTKYAAGGEVDEELLRRVSKLLHDESNLEWIPKKNNSTYGQDVKRGMKIILESQKANSLPTSDGMKRLIDNLKALVAKIDTISPTGQAGGGINEDLTKLKLILTKFIECLKNNICDEETKEFIRLYLNSMETDEEIQKEIEEEITAPAAEAPEERSKMDNLDGGARRNRTRKHKH